MIPLLGWIAKNAPLKYKATFFSVFASFSNLALSARELFTKYLNQIFVIKREVIDQKTSAILEKANYNNLDELLICLNAPKINIGDYIYPLFIDQIYYK